MIFVYIGSRIFQETYQKVECEAKEFVDISFQVENEEQGTFVYISQEEQIHIYTHVAIKLFSINDTVQERRLNSNLSSMIHSIQVAFMIKSFSASATSII